METVSSSVFRIFQEKSMVKMSVLILLIMLKQQHINNLISKFGALSKYFIFTGNR